MCDPQHSERGIRLTPKKTNYAQKAVDPQNFIKIHHACLSHAGNRADTDMRTLKPTRSHDFLVYAGDYCLLRSAVNAIGVGLSMCVYVCVCECFPSVRAVPAAIACIETSDFAEMLPLACNWRLIFQTEAHTGPLNIGIADALLPTRNLQRKCWQWVIRTYSINIVSVWNVPKRNFSKTPDWVSEVCVVARYHLGLYDTIRQEVHPQRWVVYRDVHSAADHVFADAVYSYKSRTMPTSTCTSVACQTLNVKRNKHRVIYHCRQNKHF